MEKDYFKNLKAKSGRTKRPPSPDIPTPPAPPDFADILAMFRESARSSVSAEQNDRFAKFAEALAQNYAITQALYPILKAIADRPDPPAPDLPPHPTHLDVTVMNPTDHVSLSRPDWYEPLTKSDIQEAIQPLIDALTSARNNEPAIDRVTLVDSDGRPIDLSRLFVQKAPVLGNVPMFRGGINQKSEVVLDGTVNGSNADFTIPAAYPTPKTGTVRLFLNGARMQLTTDYTQSGRTFTMNTAPPSGGQAPVIDYEAQ
jgi:hypothetical protein